MVTQSVPSVMSFMQKKYHLSLTPKSARPSEIKRTVLAQELLRVLLRFSVLLAWEKVVEHMNSMTRLHNPYPAPPPNLAGCWWSLVINNYGTCEVDTIPGADMTWDLDQKHGSTVNSLKRRVLEARSNPRYNKSIFIKYININTLL